MSTLLTPGPRTVTRLWETACAVREIDLSRIVRDRVPALATVDGPQHQIVPLDGLLVDPDALRAEFRAAVDSLKQYGLRGGIVTFDFIYKARLADAPTPEPDIELTAEIWRSGYEVPQDCTFADLVGWCFISATTPRHEDSGSVAILDPRAGSEGTAMPGLPWGREYTFRPVPGLLAVVPGWLTSTIRPLEDGQTVVVVVARATPGTPLSPLSKENSTMSDTTTARAVEAKSLSLDAPGLGVTADNVDAYTDLAAAGIVGAGANNCGAVQNNAALSPDTTVTLKASETVAA